MILQVLEIEFRALPESMIFFQFFKFKALLNGMRRGKEKRKSSTFLGDFIKFFHSFAGEHFVRDCKISQTLQIHCPILLLRHFQKIHFFQVEAHFYTPPNDRSTNREFSFQAWYEYTHSRQFSSNTQNEYFDHYHRPSTGIVFELPKNRYSPLTLLYNVVPPLATYVFRVF